MRERSGHRAPIRLWSPGRFRALVSAVAAAAAGLVPAAVVLLPAGPAHAASPGDIIIEADLDDVEGAAFAFEIRRVGPTSTPFTLTYETVTSGLPAYATPVATPTTDFTPIVSGSALFDPSGRDVVKRIVVSGVSDASDENNEWFGLSLTNVQDPYNNLALGKLTDDDLPPTYSFGSAATVAENVGSVTATATLSAPSAFPVTVPYTTTPGTATDGEDYTAQSGTLSFAPGDAAEDVVVPILDDSQNENASETFTVTSTAGAANATEATTSKTVTITDDDAPPTVSISSAGSVREGDTLNFPITLSGASRLPVSVTADTTGGSATSGADYDAVSSVPVNIPAGQTTANLPVVTKTDATDESGPGETVQVTISGETNATLGTAQNTGTIVDSVVSIAPVGSITEDDTGTHNQVFNVTLSAAPAAPAAPIEIGYTVAGGSATAGVDFEGDTGTLSFGAGQDTKTITVPVHGDRIYEGTETISITLTHGAGKVTGGLTAHSFNIPDDDAAPTIASVAPVSVAEGESDHVENFVVTLSNPSTEEVTVNVTSSDVSAAEALTTHGSDDYDVIDNTSVAIAPGATTANIRVRVKGDAIYEAEETATITATVDPGETGATPNSTQSGTLTITNEDALPVITLNNLTGAEGNATLAVNATVTGTAQDPIGYTMSAADGTAESLDYNASGLVNGAIDPNETSLSLGTVNILDDAVDDAVDAFDVTITPAGGVAAKTATVTITDDAADTPPKIVGTTSPSSVAENAGPAVVPVTLDYTGSSASSTENVISVDYATSPNTAKATLDYTAETGTLTFTPGQAAPTLDILLTNDNYFEVTEDFTVTLSNPQGTSTLEQDTATVTVTDDDGSPPGFTVAQTGSVTEGGLATFTVTMTGPAAVDTVFDITHLAGTAVGDDYTDPTGGTVTVNKDQTTATFTVQTTADNIYEGNENATITVTRAAGMTSVDAAPQSGTLTITEDDQIPTLILNSVNTNEDAGTFDITATRTGVAEDAMSYTVTVAGDGDASYPAAGGDFTAAPNTVTIAGGTPAGSETTLHTVALTDDQVDENTETLKATVVNDTVSTPSQTSTYGILDSATDLSPELVYGSAVTVSEGGGAAVVPVSKDWTGVGGDASATEKTITVQHDTVDGTATAANDFDAVVGGTLSFAPGDTTKNISVPLKTDTTYELTEQFAVRLSSPSGGSTIPVPDATVTITDDDTASRPAFSVDPATPTTATEGQTVEYTIRLSEASLTDTDFDVTLAGGEAQAGGMNPGEDDYTPPATSVRINAGATSVKVSVPLLTDSTYEGTETRVLSIALAGGETDVTGTTQTRTITITDADTIPTLALTAATGAENTPIAIAAVPTGVAQHQMTYTLTVAGDAGGGNAAEAEDYTHSLTTVNVPAGSASGVSIPFGNVTAAPDTIDEPNETFRVTAHNDTYNTTPNVSALYTITDDAADTAPSVNVASPVTVGEADGTATVPVTLDYTGSSATHTEKAVTVDYTTDSGTATPGSDYTSSAAGLSFPSMDNSENISVPISPDSLFETNEQFGVTISNAAGATLGTATNTVTITDDDSGAIPGFSVSTDPAVTEGAGVTAQLTVTLDSPAADAIDFDATISDVSTTDGGSLSLGKDDYTAPVVDFTVAKDQRTATVNIPIADDSVYEGAETFTVQIARDAGETLATGAPVTRTVTINDDESVPTLTMVAAEAAENASAPVTATITGVAERDMVYSLALAGDATGGNNAAEAGDFTDSPGNTTVNGGTASGSTVNLGSIPLLADQVDEPVETIKATATNTTYTGAVSAFYTIADDPNDKPPSVSLGPVTVGETAGNADVPVTLSFLAGNDATSSEQPVAITHQVTGITADGLDFGLTTNPAVIVAGATTGAIRVPITDDIRYEPTETFQVRATAVSPAGAAIGTDTALVTVTDNDVNVERPTFGVDSQTVSESAGSATFTVSLSTAAPAAVDLAVSVADGTATEAGGGIGGDDYDAPAGTVRIPEGARGATFTVPVRDDKVFEHEETAKVTVALAGGEEDATGAAKESTLTIGNDDAAPVLTMTATGSAAEGETLSVTGTVDAVAQPTLKYGTPEIRTDPASAGDPAEATDFTFRGGEVVVPGGTAGGTTVDIASITFNDDTVDEDDETVALALGTRTGTYRITDDPQDAAPSVSISDETIGESEGSVDLTVSLRLPEGATGTERTVTVPWKTVPGTAESGGDYVTTAGTATFEPGTRTATVKVPITPDGIREENQQFTVRLGAATPADVEVAEADGTVTIEDDDTAVRPTLNVASAVITGSQRVKLTGVAAPGAKVELLTAVNPAGSGGYRVVLTTEADQDGDFSFNPNFTQGYRIYARSSGLVSPVRTVTVRQDPVIAATSSARGTATVTVTGDPGRTGQTVTVQRLSGGSWSRVASGKLDEDGRFRTTQRSLRSGSTYTYRAVIAATPSLGILAGTSPTRAVRVR